MANFLSKEICVCVTNYDFSENATELKKQFGTFFHTILIDSSSPSLPEDVDIVIANSYYPGLWNSAVHYAITNNFKYLMFVASDLQINNVKMLCEFSNEATQYQQIGVYSSSISPNSRVAFPALINSPTSHIRETGVMEGFFFLARVEILKSIYPISPKFKYGWGIDILTCHKAYEFNYIVVVDDRVEIFHPASKPDHAIDPNEATIESASFIDVSIIAQFQERQKQLQCQHKYINNA